LVHREVTMRGLLATLLLAVTCGCSSSSSGENDADAATESDSCTSLCSAWAADPDCPASDEAGCVSECKSKLDLYGVCRPQHEALQECFAQNPEWFCDGITPAACHPQSDALMACSGGP
jgi:hypothetical protein